MHCKFNKKDGLRTQTLIQKLRKPNPGMVENSLNPKLQREKAEGGVG